MGTGTDLELGGLSGPTPSDGRETNNVEPISFLDFGSGSVPTGSQLAFDPIGPRPAGVPRRSVRIGKLLAVGISALSTIAISVLLKLLGLILVDGRRLFLECKLEAFR